MAHSHYKLLLCILSIISAVQTTYSVKNRTINILCLLPYIEPPFNPSFRDGPQIRLALELAKEEINNQTKILPDYQIKLIHDNSGCQHINRARESLVRNVYSLDTAQRPVGIIGPGCSGASIAVSALTSRNELSLVTVHGAASFLLENRLTYRYGLGSLGSAKSIVTLAKQLIKTNKWGRVTALFEETRPFYSVLAMQLAADLNTNSTTQRIIPLAVQSTSILPLDSIVQQGLRINFLFTVREMTRRILCLARHKGMVYDAYQWVVTIHTLEELTVNLTFEHNGKSYHCSESDFKEIALNGSLLINFQLLASKDSDPVTYSKYSSSQYNDIIHQEFECNNLSSSIRTTYFYDSLWAWAVVLHGVTSSNSTPDLTTHLYGNTTVADSILEEFYQLNFQGVSGQIRYSKESGFLDRTISVLQVTNGSAETVGRLHNESELELYDSFVAIDDSFSDEIIGVDTPVVSVFMVITFLQLVIVGALHVLTIIYRKYPSVKASSVSLNQLIFSGCYLMGVGTLFFIIGSSNVTTDQVAIEVLCNLSVLWLLPISFTLTFGTVAVKTFRLYRIFVHRFKPGQFISDTYLTLVVCVLLLVDVVSSTILTSTNPQRLISMNFSVTMGVASFQRQFQYCSSNQPGATIGVTYGYRFVLIVVVLILAILTRKIKRRSFSTAALQILVYFSTPVLLVGLALFYMFQISMPESLATFFIPAVTYNLVLLLLITLVCLPPLLPKLREILSKKPNSITHHMQS